MSLYHSSGKIFFRDKPREDKNLFGPLVDPFFSFPSQIKFYDGNKATFEGLDDRMLQFDLTHVSEFSLCSQWHRFFAGFGYSRLGGKNEEEQADRR